MIPGIINDSLDLALLPHVATMCCLGAYRNSPAVLLPPPRVLLDPQSSSLTHALPFRCRVLRQVAAETVDPRFLEVLPPHRPLASILSDASIAATSLCTPVSGGRPSVPAVLVIPTLCHISRSHRPRNRLRREVRGL